MKVAASLALADLIPDEERSETNIIPNALDPRVAPAVPGLRDDNLPVDPSLQFAHMRDDTDEAMPFCQASECVDCLLE